ncbi:arsenate reductase (glutaredoxin) [Shimia sp. R11_0]|uniref:arsenate reductase (glutaredoxin) n=1 Tax=Shimia sp. R11_0 TaxID=2821096 RepID=UPI001ADC5015|nr:arsenate reductase (glutaredoxin) [Shimia sp. R11_0]MBO9477300.1 arsenate reductase (glutaredoxin) [Shimia sp. R11_0]
MITIWHNPRCSKSRQTLALLEEKGTVTVRRYLEDTPNLQELQKVLSLLGGNAIDMMRPKEARFKEMGLSKEDSEETLLKAMAENPILIERPIVMANNKAAIGRPPEAVLDIL